VAFNGPATLRIFDNKGEEFATGYHDDPDFRNMLHWCTAIGIAEYLHEKKYAHTSVHFLLIIPDELQSDMWRRVGMGVASERGYLGLSKNMNEDCDWDKFCAALLFPRGPMFT